jgi:hypothetical protein
MKKIIAGMMVFLPGIVAAQPKSGEITSVNGVISKFEELVNAAIPVLITLAVLYIIYAVVRYMIAGNEEDKGKSKGMVGWGVLGLFIILSIWGLVNILVGTFSLDNKIDTDKLPQAVSIKSDNR